MNRYVKKTIAVEAIKWKGFNNHEIEDFAGDNVKIEVIREGDADRGIPPCIDCSIKTLEGVMTANSHSISNIGMTNINTVVNIITNNADISFIISRSIVSLIISPQL